MGRNKKEERRVVVSTTIDSALLDKIKEIAEKEKITVSYWIYNLIKKELEK